jgi:hypothetical protein
MIGRLVRKASITAVSQHCEGLFASPRNIAAAKNPNQCAIKLTMYLKMKSPDASMPGLFLTNPV